MIKEKDVITIKIPFPDISSDLAINSHMYICYSVQNNEYKYLKCQTAKPAMTSNKNFICEDPDITRNPFKRKTAVDCNKIFLTKTLNYDDSLKTKPRPDISDDFFNEIKFKLSKIKFKEIQIDEKILKKLNNKIK